MNREQIFFELAALDVNIENPFWSQLNDLQLASVLTGVKSLHVRNEHMAGNIETAHEMIAAEGMRGCPFCGEAVTS